MRGSGYIKSLVFGVIVIIIGANAASSIVINESNDSLEYTDLVEENVKDNNNLGDNKRHFYFLVDFTVTVRDNIFCNYLIFDIQGRDFIPYFNAMRLSTSYGSPVVDINIRRMDGKTYDFTLTDRTFIFASMLSDVETDLPRFGNANDGYFEGTALFLFF